MTNNIKKLSGICGILGVLMLVISFNINPGPPAGASYEQLISFGHQYYASILWGAWLQTIGPFLIVIFAFSLVFLFQSGPDTWRLDGFFWSSDPDDHQPDRNYFLYSRFV